MIFPGLSTALIAAAIAVPALLLLYFLKLRRKQHTISSTFLWKKAIEDLRVNAPFQKLRKNLLLFLQLLILIAVLAALANPIASIMKEPPKNVVILIDRSGSMNTRETGGHTRLDHAKDSAVELVERLPDEARAMVISFADRADVVCTFTRDRGRLKRLINTIESTDATTKMQEALQLAVAYSSHPVEQSNTDADTTTLDRADIELFSDGRIADARDQALTRGTLRYHRVGEAVDNVGIVAFDVRREVDRPGIVSVFTSIANFGPQPVKTDVTLKVDGKMPAGGGAVREVTLGPPAQERDTSVQSIVFELTHETGGIVEVQIHREDALEIDNKVVAPIDPPQPVRLLVVTARGPVQRIIAQLARSLDIDGVVYKSPAEYEAMPESDLVGEGRSSFDIVLLDAHDTQRLPPGNYMFFGGAPKIEAVALGEEVAGGPILIGHQTHPLLRNVNYDSLYISKWKRPRLPPSAIKLMEGEDATVMALVADPGHRYLITTFDLLDSNWPLKEAFPIFMQNAIHYLAAGGALESSHMIHPGDSFTLNIPPAATEVTVLHPDESTEKVQTSGRDVLTYASTRRSGLYAATFNDGAESVLRFGVNCLDSTESNVRPYDKLQIGAESIAGATGPIKMNEPLWPWLAAAALVFVIFEWWVYNKRVMI
jgi:hypothetical protein